MGASERKGDFPAVIWERQCEELLSSRENVHKVAYSTWQTNDDSAGLSCFTTD